MINFHKDKDQNHQKKRKKQNSHVKNEKD